MPFPAKRFSDVFSSRSLRRSVTPLFLLALSLSWVPTASAAEEDGLWISLGADAFERLQSESSLSFGHRPLQELAEKDGVVVTRILKTDVDAISRIIHDDFQRCSGFLVHPSLEEATQAVEASFTSQLLGGTIPYIIDQAPLVEALQPQVTSLNIQNTIVTLSENFNNRYYQHASGVAASSWIRDLWQGYATGRPEVTAELFDHPGWAQPSVILTIPGTTLADQVVVLGGHMDSIAGGSGNPDFIAPGADDNASGIAALSEAARVLLANDFRPQRTVKFMAYAAEEVGLLGSQEIATQHVNDGINVVAVLQLDMTGFNGSTEDMGLLSDFTNSQLTSFIGELVDVYQPQLLTTSTACGYGCSDHAAWHNRGFPAAMPFEARVGQHNGAIHSTQDTFATLGNTADHSRKFSQLAVAFSVELGLDDLGELFLDGFESGSMAAWSATVP